MAEGADEAPDILDLPIGLDATGTRAEFDTMGGVEVPADRLWGAQSARSLEPLQRSATTSCRAN